MNGYLLNFLVYSLAMAGIMMLSVVVYKRLSAGTVFSSKKQNMKIEESLSLSPKKTLYVVNVQNERFLIASDTERTSFLAKLDDGKGLNVNTNKLSDVIREQVAPSQKYYSRTPNIIPGINPHEIKMAASRKRQISQQMPKTFSQTLYEESNNPAPVMRNLASQIKLRRI